MKKNFVKKTLASTLALAMVATAMPAAFTTASAAKAPALNKTSKTLYINDNEIGSSFDFNISNKVAKSTYKWTTSNKAVATVNSKGLTKAATKTGKATISCKITLPTKKTKTLKATVTVKENATKVWVKNAPEKEIGIGEKAYDFNSAFSTASGAKATDYRTWEIDAESNTAGATIDAKSGVVTTTKAGEFKVRVRAYQNKAKLAANDTVDSEWLTVKVVSSVVSAVQTTATKLAVTFDDNMKDKVKASDFVIENTTSHVKPAIKDLSFSEDGKVVVLETYQSFEDGKTYSVTYNGTAYDFTTSIGDVATLEITTTTAVIDTDQEIKFVLKNANGVDITDLKKGNVTIEEVENNKGFYDSSSNKVRLWEKGAVAKFKATYHTYDYNTDGTEKGSVTVEFSVVGVEASTVTFGTMKYTITDKTGAPNWDKVTDTTTKLAIGDGAKYIHVYAKGSDDSTLSGVKFESGNSNVLLVGDDGLLTGVKEGVAHVVVKKDDKIIGTCAVTVLAARKATTVSLDVNSITVSNSDKLAAEKVAITLKDQHGDKMADAAYGDLTVESVKSSNPPMVSIDGKNVVINSADVADGTYQYKIKIDNSKLTVITVVVKKYDPNKAISSYKLQLSAQTVDTVVTVDSKDDQKVDISLSAYNTDGVKADMATFKVEVTKPDGKVDTAFTADGATSYSYTVRSFDTTGTAKKVATGTYKVTASVYNSKTQKYEVKGYQYFKVEDTQVAPTVKLDKQNSDITTGTDVVTIINAAFVIKDSNGKQYGKDADTSIVGVKVDESKASDYYVVNGKTVHIKKVIVTEEIATGVYVDHVVTVGQSVYTK